MENTVFLKIAKNSQVNKIDHILVNIEPLRQFSIQYIFVHGDFSAEVVTISKQLWENIHVKVQHQIFSNYTSPS